MRELFDLGTTRIDAADVERIHQLDGQQQSEKGTVFSADETLQENRRCTIQWIKNDWLHDLLWSYVESANRSTFGFDVIEDSENTKQMLQDMHSSDVLGEAAGVGSTSPPSRGWHRVSSGASAGASSSLIMEDDGIVEEDLDL